MQLQKIPFELNGIEYNQIKYEISNIELIELKSAIERNFMKIDDIKYFASIY